MKKEIAPLLAARLTRREIFARFYSPGTLFAETSERRLETGTLEEAVQAAKSVKERHGATPYGFDLITKIVAPPVPDGEGGTLSVQPKEVDRKGRFYLGGKLLMYEDAEDGSIMASNMRCNRYPICIENTNSYRFTYYFEEGDAIVDPDTGKILRRGDEEDLVAYCARKCAEWDADGDGVKT